MDRLPEKIDTPRLRLRCWRADDAEALTAAVGASIEHLRPWMSWASSEPVSVEERARFIEAATAQWASGGDAIYGVFRHDAVVGGCGLHRRGGPDTLEIGYWIHADHLRQGYATELARALTMTALGLDGIERVEIHHDKANRWSGAVARSLGFEQGPEQPDEILAPAEVGIDCTWVMTGPVRPSQ